MGKKTKKTINVRDYELNTPGWLAYSLSNGEWRYESHLIALDKLLIAISNRKFKGLIVNMPPRHGKSELISKYFPLWYLARNPNHRIILTTYEASFAEHWGRQIKNLIKEHGRTKLGIQISSNKATASCIELDGAAGSISFVGAGGAITGKGANLLIIDDPVKNDKEANSFTIRNNIWNWFKATAFTRLEPNGIVVLVMTRWHEDDICGRLEAELGSDVILIENVESLDISEIQTKWLKLNIPALAEENDPLGRTAGAALWNDRYPLEKLNEIKRTLGSYYFSALYQQSPMRHEGSLFNRMWFKYFKESDAGYELNHFDGSGDSEHSITIDLAISQKEESDYTVALVFATTQSNEILVLEVFREKMTPAKHIDLIEKMFKQYKPQLIGIEAVQYQVAVVEEALKRGYPVKQLKPKKDKKTRAMAISAKMENGMVYFRANAEWLAAFEDELLQFPAGRHDDQVDALAYAAYLAPVYCESSISVMGAKSKNKKTIHLESF